MYIFAFRIVDRIISTDVNGTIFQSVCPQPDPCNPSGKYRTFDGSCNNILQPKYGWTHTPYQRVLPNAYFDGNFFFKILKNKNINLVTLVLS